MPVTLKVAEHDAVSYVQRGNQPPHTGVKSPQEALTNLAWKDKKDIGDILMTGGDMLQTSLTDERLQNTELFPVDHGLVRAAFHAYSSHQNLVLRPEDIWVAILTQFSFYVNANSEKLRKSFVAHEGQKGLILEAPEENDMSLMCRNMTKLLDQNVVDPELKDWILPSFSTTTVEDETIAAVIMMGTLQSYFRYVFSCATCGIPSVTLLGEREDWEEIAHRVEKLDQYGEETARFGALLKPVLREMIACFDPDNGDTGVEFWNRIVSHIGGSGMDYISGWITVFCHWNSDGKLLSHGEPEQLQSGYLHDELPQRLYDIRTPTLAMSEIPCCFVSVPVLYVTPESERIETKLLAGFAGFEAVTASASASQQTQADDASRDTLRPVAAWWMFRVKNPQGTGDKSMGAFYADKLANEWKGGLSTGYVQADRSSVVVEHGLPRQGI